MSFASLSFPDGKSQSRTIVGNDGNQIWSSRTLAGAEYDRTIHGIGLSSAKCGTLSAELARKIDSARKGDKSNGTQTIEMRGTRHRQGFVPLVGQQVRVSVFTLCRLCSR